MHNSILLTHNTQADELIYKFHGSNILHSSDHLGLIKRRCKLFSKFKLAQLVPSADYNCNGRQMAKRAAFGAEIVYLKTKVRNKNKIK